MLETTNQEQFTLYKDVLYEIKNEKGIIYDCVGRRIIVPKNRVKERINEILKEDKSRWN